MDPAVPVENEIPAAPTEASKDLIAEEMKSFEPPEEFRLYKHVSSLVCLAVLLVFGVPTWWSLTTTYRATLPYHEIKELSFTNLSPLVKIHVVSFDGWLDMATLGEFELDLSAALKGAQHIDNFTKLLVHYDVTVRPSSTQEAQILRTSANLEEFETSFFAAQPSQAFSNDDENVNRKSAYNKATVNSDSYFIFLLHRDEAVWRSVTPKQDPPVGLLRHSAPTGLNARHLVQAYVATGGEDKVALKSVQDRIYRLFNQVLVRGNDLDALYRDTLGSSDVRLSQQQVRDKSRSMPLSTAYEVNLLLTVARPEEYQVGKVPTWDLSEALRVHMEPLLSQLSRYVRIRVASQYLHSVDLEIEARKSRTWRDANSSTSWHYYTATDLPHLINPLHFYVSNPVSHFPQILFTTYIPGESVRPLYIVEKEADSSSPAPQLAANNAFLVSQWGGMLIWNDVTHVDTSRLMPVFAQQLLSLLGIQKRVSRVVLPLERETSQHNSPRAAAWQVSAWLRERTVRQLGRTSLTLRSMVHLLDAVSNLVVRDAVANHVFAAVEAYEQALYELKHTGNLRVAFTASQRALDSAEKAFFDPSLIELLYFPDDQKHGIYMPFFLPLLLYCFLGTANMVRYFRVHGVFGIWKPKVE